MKVFILFSHYLKLAQSLKEFLILMVGKENQFVKIEAIGGIDNELGTNLEDVVQIIKKYPHETDFYIFGDLGSSIITANAASIMLENQKIHVIKSAFVENAFAAYLMAWNGLDHDKIYAAANEQVNKSII